MNYRDRIIFLGTFDSLIIASAVLAAYVLRFEFQVPPAHLQMVPYVILLHVVLTLLFFFRVKVYRRVWQYASVGELISLFKAVIAAEILIFIVHTLMNNYQSHYVIPLSIYILVGMLTILGVGGSRFAWRVFRDNYLKIKPYHRRTLIIGAGQAGYLIAKELKHSPHAGLYPIAFIDDDPGKWELEVLGLPVIGGREKIPEAVERLGINKIVVALPSATKVEISKILEICKTTRAKVRMLPKFSDLINKKVSINMIREVNIEDLLGREPVKVDLEGIADYLTNQVVLVTGAGGSIGSELCRQVAAFKPKKLLLLGHGENSIYNIEMELRNSFPEVKLEPLIADIQDIGSLEKIFNIYRPTVVFHAAAHKHVPLMEDNPTEAVKNNVFGTRNVAECAHKYKSLRFILVSTDKAVNPTNVMGATKNIAEMVVQSLNYISETKFAAVRFGNVLGSRGSVVPLFKKQIEEGGPVTVTHSDIIRYFMTIPEAVQLVIQAGALAKGGEVFVLDMGEPVRIADLARDLIRLSGLEPDKDIKITYTGLRPGEKMYEELLTDEEGISATTNQRIFIGKRANCSWEEIKFIIKKLEQLISTDIENKIEIKRELMQIIAVYKPGGAKIEIDKTWEETAAGSCNNN